MAGIGPPAEAAECGGSIVSRVAFYKGHVGIWVNKKDGGPITRITFQNDNSREIVPDAQHGISYNVPLGYESGKQILGVSKRWVANKHMTTVWDTWRWTVLYKC